MPVLVSSTIPRAENDATAPDGVLIKFKGEPGKLHCWPTAGAKPHAADEKMPGLTNVNVNWACGREEIVMKFGTEIGVPTGSPTGVRLWSMPVVPPRPEKAPVLVDPTSKTLAPPGVKKLMAFAESESDVVPI